MKKTKTQVKPKRKYTKHKIHKLTLLEQLTQDLMYARQDAERLVAEYKNVIAELRQDKAQLGVRLAMYEAKAGLRPVTETKAQPTFDFSAFPPVKTRWQQVQEEHDAKNAKELAEEAAQKGKVV